MILLNTQVMSIKKHNTFHICKYIITNSTYNNYNLEFIRNGMIEMLSVFICEDDKIQLEYFRKFIDDAITIADYDMQITLVTTNPNDIIEYVKNNEVHGLYYIDVKLDCGMNGFELVEYIREYDQRAFVVFITAEEKNSYLSLEYLCEPLDYIIKNYHPDGKFEMRKRIGRSLRIAHDRSILKERKMDIDKDNLVISVGGKKAHVDMSDVVWIEKNKDNPNKVVLQGCNNQREFIGTLKEVLDQLDDRFMQIGKSYIINKDRIKNYNIRQKLISLKDNTQDGVAVTLQVSHEAMETFLDTIYPHRNKSIKSKTKKLVSKIFKKREE